MRGYTKELTGLGVLERHRQAEFPSPVDYRLGAVGRDLMVVASVLQDWLSARPEGPLTLGTPPAQRAVKALVKGWSSTIVRALAARPLSLTDLNRLIAGHNYPSLERRLAAMRTSGLVEAQAGISRSTPYAVTDWQRRAAAPVAAAARWERLHAPAESTPIGGLDIEAAFLLAVPLLRLGPDATGSLRLAVEVGSATDPTLAGVQVDIEAGRVVACHSRLSGRGDARVSGPALSWIRALIDEDPDRLEMRGDRTLALKTLAGLRDALARAKQAAA